MTTFTSQLSDLKTEILYRAGAYQDWLAAAGLFLLTIFTRLPFTERIFYQWDSVNFAFAMQKFDIANGQPQVPGYILYVGLAKVVNLLFNDAQTTLVAISLVSSGVAAAALYLLGREMFNRTTGLAASLFLATSPLFWFYGELALPHPLDAFVVIVLVWMLYRISQGHKELWWLAAIWLAIAGGLRQQTELFMAPLAIYAGWRLGWKRIIGAVAVLAAVNLAWFIPLMALSGGIQRYFFIMNQFTAYFDATTSVLSGAGLFGLERNSLKLLMYTAYGWSLPGIFILAALIKAGMAARGKEFAQAGGWKAWILRFLKEKRAWFFALWILPTVGYYLMVHMGQQGLTFVYLPALLLLSAAALGYLRWERAPYVRLAAFILLLANSAIFLAAPQYPLGTQRVKLLTLDTLNQHSQYYTDRISAIEAHFNPQNTLLLSSAWRFPQYYLPQYHFEPYYLTARWEEGEGSPQVATSQVITPQQAGLKPAADGSYYLVLFDDDLAPFDHSAQREQFLPLAGGGQVAYIRLSAGENLQINPQFYQVGK